MKTFSLKSLINNAFIILFFISASTSHVYASSGTCSDHGGVNCSIGPDWDGSAICNDGWHDSSELYFKQAECQQTAMCTEYQWDEMSGLSSTVQLSLQPIKDDRARFAELIDTINALNIDYPMIAIRGNQAAIDNFRTGAGEAPLIASDQTRNRNAVATSTHEAILLDQKLRAGQMVINQSCIALGVQAQKNAQLVAQLALQKQQAVPPPILYAQPTTPTPQPVPQTPPVPLPQTQLSTPPPAQAVTLPVVAQTSPVKVPQVIVKQASVPPVVALPAPILTTNIFMPTSTVSTTSVVAPNPPSVVSVPISEPKKQPSLLENIFSPFKHIWAWFFK